MEARVGEAPPPVRGGAMVDRSGRLPALNERWETLVVGLLAVVPVLVSTARALHDGWAPVFDDGILAIRAYDVPTGDSSLVGVFSDASIRGEPATFGAGPLLFWLLAVPVRLPGDWALPLTAGLISALSILGCVVLARRRGGRAFMVMTAGALVLMTRSLPAGTPHDILNARVELLPLTLLFFLAWSLACGEYRLLPLTVLVASFVVQSHFSVAVAALAAVSVGVIGLAVWLRTAGDRRPSRGELARWGLAALAVAAVCWTAPLVEEAIHNPGNLSRIRETAAEDENTLPLAGGRHALVRAVGVPPWWLRGPRGQAGRFADVLEAPRRLATLSCLLILGALALTSAVAIMRRRLDVLSGSAFALLLCGCVVLTTSITPSRLGLAIDKALFWTSPAGMMVWLMLGWSIATLVGAGCILGRRQWPNVRVQQASMAGVAALTGLTAFVSATQETDQWRGAYRPARAAAERVADAVPKDRTVLVVSTSRAGTLIPFAIQTGLVYQLRRSGYRVALRRGLRLLPKVGPQYAVARRAPHDVVLIEDRPAPSRPNARPLLRTSVPPGTGGHASALPLTVSTLPAASYR